MLTSICPIRPDAPVTTIPGVSVISSSLSPPDGSSRSARRPKARLQQRPFGIIWPPCPDARSGPTQRQLRVGELIRRTLSEVLARGEVHDPDLNRIPITVGEVVGLRDLKTATAYVLPLGGAGRDEMLARLPQQAELRRAVTRGLALKFSPELRFAIDETFDRLDDTRRLFAEDRVRRDIEAEDEGGDDGCAASFCACLGRAGAAAACRLPRADVCEDADYTVCKVAAGEDLRLFLTAPDGEPYGSFDRLRARVGRGRCWPSR